MTTSDDDNLSHCSSVSNRQRKIECEFCNNEFQARSYFNHCKTKHGLQFSLSMINLIKKVKDVSEPFLYEHHYTDEQDEQQILSIYICLASNKTFLNEKGWRSHFKKHPAELKKHIQELKKLKASIADCNINYFQIASKSKDKALTRAFYRRCLYLIPKIGDILNIIFSRDNEKDNLDKDVSNRPTSERKSYMSFERMRDSFIFTKKQVQDAINSESLQFDPARKYWEDLEAIVESIKYNYDCGLLASPESETNKYGLIIPIDVEAPHFGVSHSAYPELDF